MIDFDQNNKLYYSVKEVAEHFNVNVSLLRFWEKEFDIIKPRKTEGGTRQFTKADIDDITLVYHLVKELGLTLDGAKQRLKHKGDDDVMKLQALEKLEQIKKELLDLISEF